MRRQLIATTALIALAAILVLGIPLGLVESARARSDALARLEREADGIAAAASRGLDARRPHRSSRARPGGTRAGHRRRPDRATRRPTTRVRGQRLPPIADAPDGDGPAS